MFQIEKTKMMFSIFGSAIYNWRAIIPSRIYVTQVFFEINLKRYLIWNGKHKIRQAVSSSGWRIIDREKCSAVICSSDGQPGLHTWSNTYKNYWGQQFAICCECGVIKATKPTKYFLGII